VDGDPELQRRLGKRTEDTLEGGGMVEPIQLYCGKCGCKTFPKALQPVRTPAERDNEVAFLRAAQLTDTPPFLCPKCREPMEIH